MRSNRFYWKQADRGSSKEFIQFLHQLHKAHPTKKLMIILDNGSTHKSKKVRSFIKKHEWVALFFLWLAKYRDRSNSLEPHGFGANTETEEQPTNQFIGSDSIEEIQNGYNRKGDNQ